MVRLNAPFGARCFLAGQYGELLHIIYGAS